jgi:hypothetical protein
MASFIAEAPDPMQCWSDRPADGQLDGLAVPDEQAGVVMPQIVDVCAFSGDPGDVDPHEISRIRMSALFLYY